jgi:hypothetical protein
MSTENFIEACRQATVCSTEWLSAIAAAAAPLFDNPLGISGYTYRISDADTVELLDLIAAPGSQLAVDPTCGKAAFLARLGAATVSEHYCAGAPRAASLSQLDRKQRADLQRVLPRDASDALGLFGGVFMRSGIKLCTHFAQDVPLGLRRVRYYRGLAAHLGAGYRVRQLVAKAASVFDVAAAVATPAGQLLEVRDCGKQGETVQAIRHAVRNAERIRTRGLRRGVAEAEALYSAFVADNYSLAHAEDTDGKQLVVALRTGRRRNSARNKSQPELLAATSRA